MSKLDDLINKLCPNGVKYEELNDVCRFQNGFSFKSNLFKEKGYPILRITNISDGKLSDSGYVYFDKEDYKENLNNYKVNKGDVVVAMSGATTGKIGYNYSENTYYLNQRVGLFVPNENKILKRYLYHWLTTQSQNIYNISSGSGAQPNLSSIKMMKFKLPVPPLEVQCEIVHILDDFTLLSAELSAELKARQKQYEYYRDEIFKFNNYKNVEYKKLSEIATIIRGGNFQKKDFIENGYPCIHYGQIYTRYGLYADKTITFIDEKVANKSKIAKPNSVIMAVTSENVEDVCKCVAWIGNTDIAVSGHTAIISSDINAKYLAYYFHTSMFFVQKLKYVHGTKVIEVTPDKLNDIVVPVVPKDKQEEIINKLDKLDKLCNDISVGLPAEIEARQKQYEYYRDKLLDFKEQKNG